MLTQITASLTAPTVSVWPDREAGTVTVVADQDVTAADWSAACAELCQLGAGPLSRPDCVGEHDVWTAVL